MTRSLRLEAGRPSSTAWIGRPSTERPMSRRRRAGTAGREARFTCPGDNRAEEWSTNAPSRSARTRARTGTSLSLRAVDRIAQRCRSAGSRGLRARYDSVSSVRPLGEGRLRRLGGTPLPRLSLSASYGQLYFRAVRPPCSRLGRLRDNASSPDALRLASRDGAESAVAAANRALGCLHGLAP